MCKYRISTHSMRFPPYYFSPLLSLTTTRHSAHLAGHYTYGLSPATYLARPCHPAARSKNVRCLPASIAVYHASTGEADLYLMLPKAIG